MVESTPLNARHGATPRQMIARWVRQQVNNSDEPLAKAEVRAQAMAHFRADPVFMDRLMAEYTDIIFADVVADLFAQTRNNVLIDGELIMSRGVMERRRTYQHLFNWREYVDGKHMYLHAMNAIQLRKAAAVRRSSIMAQANVVVMFEALAEKLKGNQTVGGEFGTEENLEEFVNTLGTRVKITRSIFDAPILTRGAPPVE